MASFDGWVQRFCDFMGRRNAFARAIDGVLAWLNIPATPPVLVGLGSLGGASAGPLASHVFMSGPPTQIGAHRGFAPAAPSSAHGPGSGASCNHLRYRGMHGTPCKYEGGSLTKCPTGTTAGGYWIYNVPAFGDVYYVDCCGRMPLGAIFCHWTVEPNWCLSAGGMLYTCTLALKGSDYGKTWNFSIDPVTYAVTWTGVY
jgi:hypothetical protein